MSSQKTESKEYGPLYETARLAGYSEGFVKVLGYWLYYRSFGESKRGTILVIHGGPGAGQDYLTELAKFSEDGFRVVMYDQLGAGKSQKPQNKLLYSMERYVEEIEGVRQALQLGKVHMWGGSFGAFLNVGYAVKYSKNLNSLMAQSGTCSSPVCIAELLRLRYEAPSEVWETMDKCEALEDTRNPKYLSALEYLYKKYTCTLDPWPPHVRTLLEVGLFTSFVYRLMWGEHEFYPTGNAKYWDVTNQLGNVSCPTLVTCGKFDEITPKNSELLHNGIKDSKLHIFDKCSHMPMWEDREAFFQVHSDFLKSVS